MDMYTIRIDIEPNLRMSIVDIPSSLQATDALLEITRHLHAKSTPAVHTGIYELVIHQRTPLITALRLLPAVRS